MRLAALALLLGACAPSLLWTGRTPDRRHRVAIVAGGGRHHLEVDGRRVAAYPAISARTVVFSDAGKMAFAARASGRWLVVVDGRPGEAWDGVAELTMSPGGRLAYAAERAGGWHVVLDGVAGPRHDAVLSGTLTFSPDGRRFAYAAAGAHVFVDGEPGPRFDGVGRPRFSADSAHVAYEARLGQDAHVVVDGARSLPYRKVLDLELSPRGGRVAYAALDAAGWRVVLDGEPGPTTDGVARILFRDDGAHVAWVAKLAGVDVLALDGAPLLMAERLRVAALAFRPDGAAPGLAYVAPVTGGGERVVVDGAPGPIFDEIATPVWSAAGELAYAARRGPMWVVVKGDRELPGGDEVGDLVYSRDGRRFGYAARHDRKTVVVVDGRERAFDVVLGDTLAFAADGSRWSVVAGDLARERLFFAVDGDRRVPLPPEEIYSAAAADVLRLWSQAEADAAP